VGIEPTIAVLETAALTTWLHPNTELFAKEGERLLASFNNLADRLRPRQGDMHLTPKHPDNPPAGESTLTGFPIIPASALAVSKRFAFVIAVKDRGAFRVKLFIGHFD